MKTIDEAEKEFYRTSCDKRGKSNFREGVDFAQQWISVNEDLPEVGEKVLIKTYKENYSCCEMCYPKDCHGTILGDKEWKGSSTFKNSITHWRPIERK